jgi:orotate phosphoribosyltransferase
VPGPFYVNTEQVIGQKLAAALLEKITAIVAATPDATERAERLNAAILPAYETAPVWQNIIRTMVAAARNAFPSGNYAFVSGGERRDWLFSIPFARAAGLPHIFLFKNRNLWCASSIPPDTATLHVADLVNNAASYFDLWLPILEKHGLRCAGTVVLNTRGTNGLQRLDAVGLKTVALNGIDLDFFEQSKANGLIDADTLEELRVYFAAPREWAARYLTGDAALFGVEGLDPKSFERLRAFFANDPWDLEKDHAPFFAAMQAAIARRRAA